jgi:hypothetical protein
MGVDRDRLTLNVDDASFLPDAALLPARPPYCLVTFANHIADADRDTVVAALATLLDHVATTTGLAIVFSAHFASTDPTASRGDSVMHDAIARRMTSPSSVAPTIDARASASLARAAHLVVASRYHPAVFAVAAGVPTIGIPVDDYTTVKLTGALGNLGQSSVLPVAELVAGNGPELVDSVWADREGIRAAGVALSQRRRTASTQWWDAVAAEFAR